MAAPFAPRGLVPQDPGMVSQFPGPVDDRFRRIYQAVQTPNNLRPTPGFFRQQGGGDLPEAPPFPAQPAPGISRNNIWSDQDLQRQVNQQRGFGQQQLQTHVQNQAQQMANRGYGTGSPSSQDINNIAFARMQADQAKAENDLRFNTAQTRAQHQLATEQAGSQQYFQQRQDEMARRQLGLESWESVQRQGRDWSALAAQLAEGEANRQQQVGMANLGHGQEVYRQTLGQEFQGGQAGLQRQHEATQAGEGRDLQRWLEQSQNVRARQMQLNELGSQRENLLSQLQMGRLNQQDQLRVQAQLGQLDAQRALLQQGMGIQGQLAGQQLAGQQQQWRDVFGQAGTFAQQTEANRQQEQMARLQSAMGQQNWMQQQEQEFNRFRAQAPIQDWLTQRQQQSQAAMQAQLFQNQMAYELPFQAWRTGEEQQTQRMGYDPLNLARRSAEQMIQQHIEIVGKKYAQQQYATPQDYQRDLMQGIITIRNMYGI